MTIRALRFVPAFALLAFCSTAFSKDFPDIKNVAFDYYQTEVLITDVKQEISAYATEYFNNFDKQGALKIYFEGDRKLLYYDGSSFQMTEVEGPNCTVWDLDMSDYYYTPLFFGWLNKEPIVIGPSALLWYAQTRIKEAKYEGEADVRALKCDKFVLPVQNTLDNLTYEYYFAQSSWISPYSIKGLRIPIRIRIVGTTSRYSADPNFFAEVEQVNDFSYFKPIIDDMNNLLPPIGLGCKLKQKADYMPSVPKVFQYSAEVVDLLGLEERDGVGIQLQKTWFDSLRLLARRDTFSKTDDKRLSELYDFNTGVIYKIVNYESCEMATLRDTDFQTFDYGLTSRMKTPTELLNLDGEFYEMGKREMRGLRCDTFESVTFDTDFERKKYHKLVVTAYFTESGMSINDFGEGEYQIPVSFLITGYETPENKTLQRQYNIFAFEDIIWPDIDSSFRLEKCFRKPKDKIYFSLLFTVEAEYFEIIEEQEEIILMSLKNSISKYAKVSEIRIQDLKADYNPTGVNVTGVILERPPALLQFFSIDKGPTVTHDANLKIIPEAETLEKCSYSCVDEGDFPCKGFYFCGGACFLKSTDPFDQEDSEESMDLGYCEEYIRSEKDSTNFRQTYLVNATANLEEAVLAKNIQVLFRIPGGVQLLTAADILMRWPIRKY